MSHSYTLALAKNMQKLQLKEKLNLFNTLKYTQNLEKAGLERSHAEAIVQIIADIVNDNLTTKRDLRELEFRLIIKLSTIMGAIVATGTVVLGLLISMH